MITTTGFLPSPILQSLAPGMLSVPTPNFNYIIPAEKYSMPRNGGTTMRFLRPVPLLPPITQLGNSGIEPASQVAQREIVDAAMSFYGTSVILKFGIVKSFLMDLKLLPRSGEDNKAQAEAEMLLAA